MRLFMVLFMVLALAGPTFAQDQATATEISSDKVTYSPKGDKVTFEGNVVVTRTDFTMSSEKLTVLLSQKSNDTAKTNPTMENIDQIIAQGNVMLQHEGKQGFCSTATYDAKQNTILMEGTPRLVDGKNQITGKQIRFYLSDYRSEVVGGGEKRVRALFYVNDPEENN